MNRTLLFLLTCATLVRAQTNSYNISFANAAHHEAVVKASFPELKGDTLFLRMSRTSPGRYALHEFAKNVYDLKITDDQGRSLNVYRPDPYSWAVTGHNGSVNIAYVLFANRGDGTYSQIDESHAHLNIPATFIYAPALRARKIEVTFEVRKDLNWKVATQLPLVSGTTFSAIDIDYFMDSPVEISDFHFRSFEMPSGNKKYGIQLALHHLGSAEEADTYFERIKKVVLAEKNIFGGLPDFDYGNYTFLACYLPWVSGDGMEHRNSTVVTSTRALAEGGMLTNLGTISHEFFHAWNVERIRPESLEPFNFEEVNMSGELWFAEGFTSYYTDLNLVRAGLLSPAAYVAGLTGTFNYVWNSPARQYFNPVEMSFQAPFTDAATSVDPVNRENTFISYYSYGSVLGLALDLSLRLQGKNLDDFMKLMWEEFGIKEKPYFLEDIRQMLIRYAGADFGNDFFNKYILDSQMPDYGALFRGVGISLSQNSSRPYFGATVGPNENGAVRISNPTFQGTPAYKAGLDQGDTLHSVQGNSLVPASNFSEIIQGFIVGDTLDIEYSRSGSRYRTAVILEKSPEYTIELQENNATPPTSGSLALRNAWLKIR